MKHYHTEQCSPTEAGLYWWKKFSSWKEWKPVVLYVEETGNPKNELYLNGWNLHLNDGEFIGPLPLPHGVKIDGKGQFVQTDSPSLPTKRSE